MICSKYLPKCTRRGPGLGPCKKLCMRAKKKCAQTLQQQLRVNWLPQFSCRGLPTRKCVKPTRDSSCGYQYPQCDMNDINTELNNYRSLVATNCHPDLKFLQ